MVTLAITLLAIFIAMLVNNHRMTDLRTDVGLRITDFGSRMDQRFADMDKRFEQRFESIDRRFEAVDKRFEMMDKRFEIIDKRFEAVDKRFEDMNRHIDDMAVILRAEMRADRAETNAKLDSILAFMANIDQRTTRLEDRIH